MQDIPIQYHSENDYAAGYARVMRFAEQAHIRGWRLSERQLVHEIVERERAAENPRKKFPPHAQPTGSLSRLEPGRSASTA